jgi:hypothetical protein
MLGQLNYFKLIFTSLNKLLSQLISPIQVYNIG